MFEITRFPIDRPIEKWPQNDMFQQHFGISGTKEQAKRKRSLIRRGVTYSIVLSVLSVLCLSCALYLTHTDPPTIYYNHFENTTLNFFIFSGIEVLFTVMLFTLEILKSRKKNPKRLQDLETFRIDMDFDIGFFAVFSILRKSPLFIFVVLLFFFINLTYLSDAVLPPTGQIFGDWNEALYTRPQFVLCGMLLLNMPAIAYVFYIKTYYLYEASVAVQNHWAKEKVEQTSFWVRGGQVYYFFANN